MIKIAFIIILSTISIIKAQTNRFFYEVKFKEDSTQTEHQKVFMVLDINPNETKYYDNTFLEKDSINKANHSKLTNWTSQIPVTRKKNSNKNINYTFIDDQLYSYPTEDLIQWKLSDKTKKYLHFDLQQATAGFGGRKWTAWFTKEIPLSEGPYKFRGLPGLIFLLEDSNKDFIYALAGNKKLSDTYDTSDFLEQHYNKKAMPATRESFNKYLVEFYNNPIKSFTDQVKNGNTVSFKNEEVKNLDELNKKKTMMQKMIKERYIYIEKDNAPIFN